MVLWPRASSPFHPVAPWDYSVARPLELRSQSLVRDIRQRVASGEIKVPRIKNDLYHSLNGADLEICCGPLGLLHAWSKPHLSINSPTAPQSPTTAQLHSHLKQLSAQANSTETSARARAVLMDHFNGWQDWLRAELSRPELSDLDALLGRTRLRADEVIDHQDEPIMKGYSYQERDLIPDRAL